MIKQIFFISLVSLGIRLNAQEINLQDKRVKINNKQVLSDPELSLPKEVYIVEGNRLEIFKHSIINAINPENYFLNAKVTKGIAKGAFYDRVFIYDCKAGDSDMELEFTLINDQGFIIDKKQTLIRPVTKAKSPSSQFNILLIGDSFSANITYPEELARRLVGSEGIPKADKLKNINFIGSVTNGIDVNREAYGGKSWNFFLGEESPFYNVSTGQIDFENYTSKNGYSSIDAVVIILGTNSISNNETVSLFLNKLIAFNPKIKGLVTGKILATPLGGGGMVGISNRQTFYGSFPSTFIYNRRMENLIQTSFSSNFKFVDILPSLDIMHNMQFSNVAANFRNQKTLVKQGSNNVHPASSAYLQIADIIYNALHYYVLDKK
ncbi:hypothetical protein [Hyunsoonleella aestuarii]|uniref:SGNH/GDSL hydrolase family protein n=1 Tax=Hyunsoonleella aestuarii TaxID=912802 RepID=A0ABP8E913_9FLAO|nr:hypothetical protein [Hyunsoonleella aestuarii]